MRVGPVQALSPLCLSLESWARGVSALFLVVPRLLIRTPPRRADAA